MQAAIGAGPRILPGAEHGRDRAPKLLVQILREGLAELFGDKGLELADDLKPVLGAEIGIELETFKSLIILQRLLEHVVTETEHDIGIHLDEAAISVVGESAIFEAFGETLDCLVVEAEIEHGVHHAGHRSARA